MHDHRVLDLQEANKLNELRHDSPHVRKWPNMADLLTIAKAVEKRNSRIKLEDGNWYTIRYKSKYEAVFIKPEKGFVPCGYKSYKELKQVLSESDD